MTTSPWSPKLVRGAIIGYDLFNPAASVILFQYNPDRLTRTLQPQNMGGQSGDRSEINRVKGAPIETIRLEAEIDATDLLERGETTVEQMGIYPQLSALEMLAYPKSAYVIKLATELKAGTIEIIPPAGPFTVFVWGERRVLPVRITSLSITEEAFDTNLNPLRASVSIDMRVLSYNDFSVTDPGYQLFLQHQITKESMAALGSTSNVGAVLKTNIQF